MLTLLNALQLLLYIGALALLGQGALYLIAGAQRQSNAVYQLFLVINAPWTRLAGWLSAHRTRPHRRPVLAFALVTAGYLAVTLAKVAFCVRVGLALCRA